MSERRDLVVIGASAGGLDAVSTLLAHMSSDLPASVLLVMHSQPGFASMLPDILGARTNLRISHALHGEPILPGRIYVAPPDMQLLVRPGYLHVVRGPKENGHRPAVDALFRTAANAYGPRTVGIVLTGFLDCGTAGLLSIKARGGIAIVQNPATAHAPQMPRSAIDHVKVDHILDLEAIGPLLDTLVREPVPASQGEVSDVLREIEGEELGSPAELVCPTCQGKLTQAQTEGFTLFRCHVGHAFSLDSIDEEQAESLERALWAASRALEESAALSRRMAASATGALRQKYLEREETQGQQAAIIRDLILTGGKRSS